MNIEVLVAPLIGGVIGLITNSLAIKMLFRPYHEIWIGKIRLPFTPGLIPKEKSRIAHAIGDVISHYILNQETIMSAMASEKIKEAYERKYDQKESDLLSMELTCEEFLEKHNLNDASNILETKLRNFVGSYVVEVCRKEELARGIINYAFRELKENMNPMFYKIGKHALESTKESLIQHVDELLERRGADLVGGAIDGIYVEWMDKPVCEIVKMIKNQFPNLREQIWHIYTHVIEEHAESFLSTLNISGIIENKIKDYDLQELEQMIMEISRKELNALVWLGGLLGMIMGLVNILFII